HVTNVVRAIKLLQKHGFWCIGLDSDAKISLEDLAPSSFQIIALGAEGPGLRRLTREACDTICKIRTSGPIRSLNVSNAAAVALFSLNRLQQN
ncbi:MAG: TrmH family RNA methyltransferase, partial [Pseudomonadota bacterium]|nr:TrmH family RNA methyltransferase [Pseudomonadota bacterium]